MNGYCVEFKHEGYSIYLTFDTMGEILDLLKKITYFEIGMSVEISTFRRIDDT